LLAVGAAAAELEWKNDNGAHWIRPVAHGRIVEPLAMKAVMRKLIGQTQLNRLRSFLLGSRISLVVSPHLDENERRKHMEALHGFGVRKIELVDSTLASAMGCGLDLSGIAGRMILDFGGGKTSVAAFAMGELTAWSWAPFGGGELDRALMAYIEHRHRVRLTATQAESLKLTLGSLYPGQKPAAAMLAGTDSVSGVEKNFRVDDNEIRDVLVDACEPLVMIIQQVFEQLSPEMAGDIAQEGVAVVGGGALLAGLPEFLMDRTGLRFQPARDPLNAVIRGGVLSLRRKSGP
jgi:rod shape-determining protein MreB